MTRVQRACRRRVRGTGVMARSITTSLAASVVALAAMESASAGSVGITPLITLAAVLSPFAVRSWFLGVWVSGEDLVYVTWWTRRSIQRSDVLGCTARPYAGTFTAGWRSALLWELEVSTDARAYSISGSLAFKRVARRQADEVMSLVVRGCWPEVL